MIWIVAAYLLSGALISLGWTAMVNPDAIAYVQIARHYAHGDIELALNAWWSPAYSWLLVPAVWLDIEPMAYARLLQVGLGLAFAAGVGALAGRLAGRGARRAAFVVALAASVPMVAGDVTPDLALAALVVALVSVWSRYLEEPTAVRAVGAGALGAAAFLVKGYALPFAVATIVLVALAAQLLRHPLRATLAHAALALATTAALVAPWITAISLHEGRPTLGNASTYASTFARMERRPDLGNDKPMYALAPVPEGRLTSWEDPLDPVSRQPPSTGADALLERSLDMLHNVEVALTTARSVDLAGFLLAALALTVVWIAFPAAPLAARDRIRLGWAAATALVFVAGYLPLLLFDRYLWPAVGIAIAVVVAAPLRLHDERGHAPTAGALRLWTPAMALLLLATLASGARELAFETLQMRPAAQTDRAVAAHVPEGSVVIGTDWARGLRVAYWADAPYAGRSQATRPEELADDLARYPAAVAVVHGATTDRAALIDVAIIEVVDLGTDVALVREIGP